MDIFVQNVAERRYIMKVKDIAAARKKERTYILILYRHRVCLILKTSRQVKS